MAKTIDSERLKTELPGMQRGEDEAGQIIEDKYASPDPLLVLAGTKACLISAMEQGIRHPTIASQRWQLPAEAGICS